MSSWWNSRGVRVRLTLWYAGTLALILALYAAGVFVFLARSLRQDLDYRLHEDFELAEGALELTNGSDIRWRIPDHADEEEGSGLIEVWSVDGRLLYRKSHLENPVAERLSQEISSSSRGYTSVFATGAGHFRVLSGQEKVGDSSVLLRVARSEEPMRESLYSLFLVLALGIPAAVGVAAFGGYVLARRALRPVQEMASQAKSITADRLGQRLPVSTPDDELGRLAIVFNETLARLESSFDQLRRFTADASHELRTPLTAIRSVGEVGLREERDAKAYREIIGSMLEEADRLGRLVDALLSLARADSGHVKLAREPVDLGEMAREAVGYLSPLAEEKQQTLLVEAETPVPATLDRLVIRQAVVNLLDNAIKYSPQGSSIWVRARSSTSASVLEVVDAGPGIAPEHQVRVFDRFYRIDKARSRNLGGSGLGLALARWAVEAHDGRIELESTLGKGSTFRISLPAARDSSA